MDTLEALIAAYDQIVRPTPERGVRKVLGQTTAFAEASDVDTISAADG